jgi:hypothetical protein
MPLYHIQYHSSVDGPIAGGDGIELPDLEAAKALALREARGIMRTDLKEGVLDLRGYIDVQDEHGNVLHTLWLKQAVTMLGAN